MLAHGRRPRRFWLAVGLVVAWVLPGTAVAQHIVASLDAQGTRLRYADSIDATAVGLTPSLRLDYRNATLSASGTYARLEHAWSADGSLGASVFTTSAGPLSAELAGTLGGSAHQDGTHTGSAIGTVRLHADGASMGTWIGIGGGAASDGDTWRDVRELEAGAWLGNGPATLTVTAQPTMVDDSIRYTDLSAEGSWRRGILELGAVAGTRIGAHLPSFATSTSTWGSVNAVAWLVPRVALLVSAGVYPVDYTQGFPGGRFVSAGVRLSLTPRTRSIPTQVSVEPERVLTGVTEIELTRASNGAQTLRVLAPAARTLEVTGDFTGWRPRALTRRADGWYVLTTPLTPGTYQMNIRMNGGEWMPPPSLPTVRDEFGGVAGVLVVH